eukprot:1161930-Pelagomonas_calceolata.AAC.5
MPTRAHDMLIKTFNVSTGTTEAGMPAHVYITPGAAASACTLANLEANRLSQQHYQRRLAKSSVNLHANAPLQISLPSRLSE